MWYNSKIQVIFKWVCYSNWVRQGLLYVGQLFHQDGAPLSYREFCANYNDIDFLTFTGLIKAIQKSYKISQNELSFTLPFCPQYLANVLSQSAGGGNRVYVSLLKTVKYDAKYLSKWNVEIYNGLSDLGMEGINRNVRLLIGTYHRWFQYRLVHRILATNSFLHKIGRAESPLCSFCNREVETLVHLFYRCPNVNRFIREIIKWTNSDPEHFGPGEIILGKRCQIELILALARIFVYRRRHTATISLPDFLIFCKEYRSSERFFFAKRGISERFNQRWRNVEFLF